MKLTKSKLRQIIQEEIISETINPSASKFGRDVADKFPIHKKADVAANIFYNAIISYIDEFDSKDDFPGKSSFADEYSGSIKWFKDELKKLLRKV